MTLRLVDAGWGNELIAALKADPAELRIICPFIKSGALERLLSLRPKAVRVITRFNLADFADDVSDIAALREEPSATSSAPSPRNVSWKCL